MKKIKLLTGALLGVFVLSGCGCSNEGTYTFNHIEYTNYNGKKVSGSCSKEEVDTTSATDITKVKLACDTFKDYSYELTNEGKLKRNGTELGFYKIDDGKISYSVVEDGTYIDLGTYSKGQIVVEGYDGVKIYFKR